MARSSTPPADQVPSGDPALIRRRAPFSDNPRVGARGQRTQQRIMEAALQVFGDVGYHQCGIARITDVAGCTRASFYQYFSSKEDVFRHLAGQVARQLTAVAESLDPITPDTAGWRTMRSWIDRHGEIYARYEPVFHAFQAASESDEAVASGSARIRDRQVATIRAKVTTTALPSRHLDDVIALLLELMTRAPRATGIFNGSTAAHPDVMNGVGNSLADVMHRTLFGLNRRVNAHQAARPTRASRRRDDTPQRLPREGDYPDLTPAGARTLEAILDAAHDALIARGYHGTRVDDITTSAGLSHGAFYRYFDNKDHVVRVLAARALQRVAVSFDQIPDVASEPGSASSAALRRWLRQYTTSYAAEAAMIRVWIDATADDSVMRAESAAALSWGRSRVVRFLMPRGFGDVDADALLLIVLLDAISALPDLTKSTEAAARVIEHGLLGRVSN